MRNERESTTAEKIAAAAAVASAAAQAKIAAEATKTRREMEEMHEAMEVAAERQERIQLAMVSEQSENNFRNTVLATLPLLETEKDRVQFLTEQFVPKLKNTEGDIVIFPLQWLILSEKKNDTIETYLESQADKELKHFLADGKKLAARQVSYAERKAELEETQESLKRQANNLFGMMGFMKIGALWAALFLTIYLILKMTGI